MLTIKKRFIITLILFTLSLVVTISTISGTFLHSCLSRIKEAPSPALIPIMADRMFQHFLFGFIAVISIAIVVSIPVGLFLFQSISKRYMKFIHEMHLMGKSRLALQGVDEQQTELQTLEEYRHLLNEDIQKLQDFEKMKGWQNGARMLLHEIKNPLTPLKLNTQRISMQGNESKEISRILTAVEDIENILNAFRDLANIDFPTKKRVSISHFISKFLRDNSSQYPSLYISDFNLDSDFFSLSEESLLKIVLINLLNNASEANQNKSELHIQDEVDKVLIRVITPDRCLYNPSQIFRLGYSEKGEGRGFGLFLCREISNYLSLDLTGKNTPDGVCFSLSILKGTN